MTLCSIGLPAKQSGLSNSTIRHREAAGLIAAIDGFESKTTPEITNAKSLVRHEFRHVLQFSGKLMPQFFFASVLCR